MNRLQEIEARLNAIKKELESDGADIDALETEVKELTEERKGLKEKVEKRNKVLASITSGEGKVMDIIPKEKEERKDTEPKSPEDVYASKEYRNAFLKTLQGKQLTDVEKREFNLVPGTGAAVVPTDTANMIFDSMTKIAPMLNEIQLLRVAGNLRFAVQGVRNPAAAHNENAAIVPAADTLVTVTLSGFEFVKVIRISATIKTMAVSVFEAWLTKILSEDLAVAIDNEIINGGTVTGNIAAAQVWADGVTQITYVGQVSYPDITNLIALLPSAFDANAKFLMSKATFYQQIMQIVDGNGNLIAIQDMSSPGQFRILGYPVLVDDNVPAGEAFLGDYKQIVGNLSSDITIDRSTESGFLNNSVDFRGTCIFDCDVAQPAAIVKLNV